MCRQSQLLTVLCILCVITTLLHNYEAGSILHFFPSRNLKQTWQTVILLPEMFILCPTTSLEHFFYFWQVRFCNSYRYVYIISGIHLWPPPGTASLLAYLQYWITTRISSTTNSDHNIVQCPASLKGSTVCIERLSVFLSENGAIILHW